MKPVFTGGLFLALALFLPVSAVSARQQDPSRKGAKKIDAKELQRQKMEVFKDAEKARKKYKAWTSQISWTLSDPFQDRTSYSGGVVKVCQIGDEKNLLWWAVKESTSPRGGNTLSASRSLYKGIKLKETQEPKRGTNTVYEYNVATLRDYQPQRIVRDGFHRGLEQWFDVEIVVNARYMKTEPNEDDWTALGFSGQEEYDAWWKSKKATTGGKQTDMKEDRPFASKEDKFNKMNPRNKSRENSGSEEHGKL